MLNETHMLQQAPAIDAERIEVGMFSHITVGTRDLKRAGRFYDAVLAPLGHKRRSITPDAGPAALICETPMGTRSTSFIAAISRNSAGGAF